MDIEDDQSDRIDLIEQLKQSCRLEEELFENLRNKEKELLELKQRNKEKQLVQENIKNIMRSTNNKITIRVSELERKVLTDLKARRDYLLQHCDELVRALADPNAIRDHSTDTQIMELKQSIQAVISENRVLESYVRGENFSSTDDTVNAVKYLYSSKEAKLKELESVVEQLKTDDENLKKIVKSKQKIYQKLEERK